MVKVLTWEPSETLGSHLVAWEAPVVAAYGKASLKAPI